MSEEVMIQDNKFELNTGEYNSTINTLIRFELSSPNGPKHVLKNPNKPAVQDLPDKSIVIMRSLHGAQEENAYRDDHLSGCPPASVRTIAGRILMSYYTNVTPLEATTNAQFLIFYKQEQ
jgi:hypothetical protein